MKSEPGVIGELFSALGIMLGAIGLIIYGSMLYFYVGAEYKADIINKEYGTNYTREDIFYASDVIDKIREIDRKRVEINGDLFTEKGEK